MSTFDWFLVAWALLNLVATAVWLGKPRKPIESGVTAVIVAINLGVLVGLLIARGAL